MESEGDPVLLDICGKYLVAGTSRRYVKAWDLTRRFAVKIWLLTVVTLLRSVYQGRIKPCNDVYMI